jgi:hypothetical protein
VRERERREAKVLRLETVGRDVKGRKRSERDVFADRGERERRWKRWREEEVQRK